MYVLDSDHVTFLLLSVGREAFALRARMDEAAHATFATTVITYEELIRGRLAVIARARSVDEQVLFYQRLREQLEAFCQISIVDFSVSAAAEFRHLRGVRIGTMDLKIAAICLAHDATLLTRNTKDFGKVADLVTEDWTIDPPQEPA